MKSFQDALQEMVVQLLSDHESEVRIALVSNGVAKLCTAFGRQKSKNCFAWKKYFSTEARVDWALSGCCRFTKLNSVNANFRTLFRSFVNFELLLCAKQEYDRITCIAGIRRKPRAFMHK